MYWEKWLLQAYLFCEALATETKTSVISLKQSRILLFFILIIIIFYCHISFIWKQNLVVFLAAGTEFFIYRTQFNFEKYPNRKI